MKDMDNRKYIKMGITAVAVVVVCLLVFFLMFRAQAVLDVVKMVTDILSPFVYGAAIAYILTPVCNRIEGVLGKLVRPKKGKGGLASALSIALTLALTVVVIWVLVMLVFPQVWESVVSLANAIPDQLANANSWLHDLLESQPELQTYWDDISRRAMTEINQWLKTDLLPTMTAMVGELSNHLAVFLGIIKNLLLGFLISVYFMASRKQFAAQGRLMLYGVFPRQWGKLIEDEVRYADRMFNGFLMGKLLDSAIIGVLCFVGTTLMGIKSAALVSVIVGVTNIIPFFGPFIGAIPSAILILLENPLHCLYFVIFVVILQQLDGNVIGPKILGSSTGLSGFWVLFSILLFGGLWGIVGMVIGVPLFAVIYDIIRKLVWFGLRKHERERLIDTYNSEFHPELSEENGTGGGEDQKP